jgi:hypothetical protein
MLVFNLRDRLFFKQFLSVTVILFLFPLLHAQTPKAAYVAFKPSEELFYNIHYGPVNAASALLKVDPNYKTFNNKTHYFISAISKTSPTWDWFYKVRDNFYSAVDTTTLYPSYSIRDVSEGDYKTMDNLVFNRTNNTIISQGKTYHAPGQLFDILSAVYYARCIDYSKIPINKEIPIYTFFDNEFFPVGLTVTGKILLQTALGRFRCLVIKPKLVEGRIFKGQNDMTIFVTDDENHIPIRVESAIFVGYVRADLVSYKNLKYPLKAKIS